LLWQSFSNYLNNVESEIKIEKALKDQGPEAAKKLEACIASGKSVANQIPYLHLPWFILLGKLWMITKLWLPKKQEFISKYENPK
jgi:nitrate/nitrite transport system permease protein